MKDLKSKQALFEALDWGIFSIGGIIAAFLLPATIVVTLLIQQPIPKGPLANIPALSKLYLFLFLVGAAWHAMHRIRFVLYGLGLSRYRRGVTVATMVALALIIVFALEVIYSL